ncbi:alpha/beta fold hydrolase [Microbacterium sp. VKM Ac-2923]|uniref:alpha/beta fold hydrolase n=1 Tax=Microbacterium sp. VKM Ac-2923 TaxID=2929476 RepID=UPI001FB46124|nr:alpha/beta hydrolase [Microbacterium sp. VKM Ac-2923]MCJ1706440.1 alpha/beta hydrolase [Microbacterium sp. VKM Ac-2923]
MDATELGLRRLVVPTGVGPLVVRAGRGSGSPVATLLLHGAAGSWTTWAPMLSSPSGVRLTDVIAVDLPGWGDTPGPVPDPAELAVAVAAVARALGYPRWRVVGHSLGGVVALDIAARFRDETVAVGVVSPSGAGARAVIRRPVAGTMRLPWLAGMVVAMRMLRALGPLAAPLLRSLARSGMLRFLARPLFRHPDRIDRSVTDALATDIRPSAFLAAARISRTHDDGVWRRIACPVRSVRGRHDVFVAATDPRAWSRMIDDHQDVVLEGSGHFAHVEQPDETLRALRDVWAVDRAPARRDVWAVDRAPARVRAGANAAERVRASAVAPEGRLSAPRGATRRH